MSTDPAWLGLVVKHVGPLHMACPFADEVHEIEKENEQVELGLIIVEPEIEDAFAAVTPSGPTSFRDRPCLLSAIRNDFIEARESRGRKLQYTPPAEAQAIGILTSQWVRS